MTFDYEPDDNGLYPAVPNPENPDMGKYWIRDNYWIWLATKDDRIADAFAEIVNKHTDKIYSAINGKATEEYMHLHPRYDENLEEIDDDWAWVQWDSVGNMIEVLAQTGYEWEATLLMNYLEAIEFWKIPDHGMWEEEKDIHPSSMGAVIRGYKHLDVNRKKVERLENVMLEHLPRTDMATYTLLFPMKLVPLEYEMKIINANRDLVGLFGCKRFEGDTWNGIDWTTKAEPEWPIGLAYLYFITDRSFYKSTLKNIKQINGTIPESFINTESNTNDPLLWAEALFHMIEQEDEMI